MLKRMAGMKRSYPRMRGARKVYKTTDKSLGFRKWLRLSGAYKDAPGKLGHIATGSHAAA
jgi:hypothetical protein